MVCFQDNVICTIVGDAMIGKTCLAQAFVGEQLSSEYVATVTGNYTGSFYAYGEQHLVNIKDTSGQHEYEIARLQAIVEADVIIICYSAVDRESFENVDAFWIQEARDSHKRKPVILVATQSDIREEHNDDHVTDVEGQYMAKKIDAEYYNKCSAVVNTGIDNVCESAFLASFNYMKKKPCLLKRMLTFSCPGVEHFSQPLHSYSLL